MSGLDTDDSLRLILDRIATGTRTEADLATLRRALLVGDQGNVIQIGKYNIKIGEGQEIRIGDAIYQGPDADAIQAALRAVLNEAGWQRRFGVPFQAPPLPMHFVPRPEVTDSIKVRLLTEASDRPGVLVVSAIHGLGGIGKSTLAAALCYSPDVQERFPDGILWATLGQQPEQLPLLTAWIQALGDYQFHPITAEAASTHLRTLLHDKAALLVVDDVWNAEHGRSFLVGGLRCCVLITTRRANVADEVGADLHELDVMTPDQSLGLLVARLGRTLDDAERSDALHLAKAVGHLPLALELTAARVRAGVTWADLRLALETEVARLGALEGPRGRRRGQTRLEASFNLSLDALRRDDEAAWRAFAWLGLLPEAVSIAAPTAATLWEISQAEAAGLLEFLNNEALLLPAVPVPIGGQAWAAYRVHDLLHDIARRMLTANLPRGLGLTLEEAHVALLERYRATVPDDRWYMLRDDGYIHAHLTWHMEQARASKAIHDLLRQENVDGQNGWWVASEKLGQTGGYLQDVERAWGLAGQTCEKGDVETPQQVGLQIRYALMAASVKSIARSMPVALLTALLRTNAWNPSQVLFYAYQISDHSQRSEALASIAMQLNEMGLIDLALQALHEVDDESWRATAFTGLASKVPFQLLQLLHSEIKGIDNDIDRASDRSRRDVLQRRLLKRAEELAIVAQHVPSEHQGQVLAGVTLIHQVPPREVALRGIVPSLPQALTDEALALAKEMPDAHVFKVLIPFLSKNQLREVLRFIESQPLYINARAAILADLARFLSATELAASIRRAYHLARGMAHWGGRLGPEVWAVCWLAPCFPVNGRREALLEALRLASSYPADWRRVEMLVELCPHLPQDLRVQALERIIQSIEQNEFLARDRVLGKPAPTDYLEGCVRKLVDLLVQNDDIFHAVWVAMQIEPEEERRELLSRLVPQITVQVFDKLMEDKAGEARVYALADLVPFLSLGIIKTEMMDAQAIDDEPVREHALELLLPRWAELDPEDALRTAKKMKNEWHAAAALAGMTSHLLSLEQLSEAVDMALGFDWALSGRAKALSALVPYLSPPLLRRIVPQSWSMFDFDTRWAYMALKRMVKLGFEQEAREAALDLRRRHAWVSADWAEDVYASALSSVASDLSDQFRRDLAMEALADQTWKALAALTSTLSVSMQQTVLIAARQIPDEGRRARLILELASSSSETILAEALSAVADIATERVRIRSLAGLARQLSADTWSRLIVELRGVHEPWRSAPDSAHFPPTTGRVKHLDDVIKAAQYVDDGDDLARVLAEMAQFLPIEYVQTAESSVREIENAATKAMSLAMLAVRLAALGYPQQAVEMARDIQVSEQAAKALIAMEPLMPAEWKGEVLHRAVEAAAQMDGDSKPRYEMLTELSCRLARLGYTQEALRAVRMTPDYDDFAEGLAKLAPLLPQEILAANLAEAREVEKEEEGLWQKTLLLARLVPYLTKEQCAEYAADVRSLISWLPDYGWLDSMPKPLILMHLSGCLPEPERTTVLRQAIVSARNLDWGPREPQMFASIVPYLPECLLPEAVSLARTIDHEYWRALVLLVLAPHLREPLRYEVAEETRSLVRGLPLPWRFQMFRDHQIWLSEPLKSELLEVILDSLLQPVKLGTPWEEKLDEDQMIVYAALAPYLSESRKRVVLKELHKITGINENEAEFTNGSYSRWTDALHSAARSPRNVLLIHICSHVPKIIDLGGTEALLEAYRACRDVGRWWP